MHANERRPDTGRPSGAHRAEAGKPHEDSNTGSRVEVLPVQPDNIAAVLKELNAWRIWTGTPRPGSFTRAGHPKLNKAPRRPIAPYPLIHAGDQAPYTFEQTVQAYSNGSGAHGISFALPQVGHLIDIVAVDLDGVRNPDTGEIDEWAMQMVRDLDTYTEVSPSGEGLRMFLLGELPGGVINNHGQGIEVYTSQDKLPHITVTGHLLEGTPREVREIETAALQAIVEPFRTSKTDTPPPGGTDLPKTPPARPEFVPAVEDLPISEDFKAFLRDITHSPSRSGDQSRSGHLFAVTVAMLGKGMDPDVAHWVLMESDALELALDKRKGNPRNAEQYLWNTVCNAAKDVRGPAGPEEFENLGEAPPTGDDWPELMPLDRGAPARLPVHLWPELLRDYATEAAAETETPVELPAMLALGVIATAAQRLVNVEIKPGFSEPIGIYTAVALPPATRKSSEFKRALAPLVQWESDRRVLLESERRIAESKLKTHEARISKLRRKAVDKDDEHEAQKLEAKIAELELAAPIVPPQHRVFSSDVTTEHLATMMAENNEVLAVIASEGGIFETMAGRYSSGVANIDLYLAAYTGDAVRVDRGSKPAVMLNDPRLTMVLTVQPDVLQQLAIKPGFKGRGLIGRVLYAVPPSNLGTRTGKGRPATGGTLAKYSNLVRELLDMASVTKTPPAKLPLSPEAHDAWYRFSQEIEAQLGSGGRFAHCTDWAGKIAGTTARIAALFHFARHGVEGVNPSISRQDMDAAIDTARALSTHALAVFDEMQLDQTTADAKAILQWWRGRAERSGEMEFTEREVYRSLQHRFQRARDMKEPLAVLVERGYARRMTKQGKVGRGSPTVLFNPAALATGAEGGNA